MTPGWKPRPAPDMTRGGRVAYFAGYGDGFHSRDTGALLYGPRPEYAAGLVDGIADAPATVPALAKYIAERVLTW